MQEPNRGRPGCFRSVAFCEPYYDLAEQRDIFSHFSDLAEHDAPKYGAGMSRVHSDEIQHESLVEMVQGYSASGV